MKVVTISEMREMDKYAMESLNIKEEILMENAGLAAYQVIEREVGKIKGKKFGVVCGTGNNGGDGLVVSRKIYAQGGTVRVFIAGSPTQFKGAAQLNFQIVKNLYIPIYINPSSELLRESLSECDCIVDAIFGTGLSRPVAGYFRDLIEIINQSGKKVVSLDIPSGVNGDTGAIMGTAIKAHATVNFGLPKLGNLLYPGFKMGGKLYISNISLPPELLERDSLKVAINEPPPLPPRDPEAHKGSVGDCLFIAGSFGYFGAPYLAAMAFYKAGGGYSRLATPRSIAGFLSRGGGEIVFVPQEETKEGTIALSNLDKLVSLAERVDMVVVGPGLSLHEETATLIRGLTPKIGKPLLIDGDGITAIADALEIIQSREKPTILTPHPGEMARLIKVTTQELAKNRVDLLRKTSEKLYSIIVLKGAHTLIGFPDGRVLINTTGNAGMATAGSGDVLTGTIAAMYGSGLPLEDAVAKGVYIHGRAGDIAAARLGMDGITASDILESLPYALREERLGLPVEKAYIEI